MSESLQALSISAGYGRYPVIREISLDLHPGEIVGVIGPNGAGKTTLLRALSGMIPLSGGQVTLGGKKLTSLMPRERARHIAWVQQKEMVSFAFSVREWVEMGRYCHTGPVQRLREVDRSAVNLALDACCLHELEDRSLNTISGGECQRAHIARALAQEASLLFLDEPLTHLDLKYQAEVYQLLHRQARVSGRGVLCVMHDLSFASSFCDRLIALRGGTPFQPPGKTEALLQEDLLSELFGVPIRQSALRFQPDLSLDTPPRGNPAHNGVPDS